MKTTVVEQPFVSVFCTGERCALASCSRPASVKVEESVFPDDPSMTRRYPPARLPLTAHLCRDHAVAVFGHAAVEAVEAQRVAAPTNVVHAAYARHHVGGVCSACGPLPFGIPEGASAWIHAPRGRWARRIAAVLIKRSNDGEIERTVFDPPRTFDRDGWIGLPPQPSGYLVVDVE